MWLTRTTLTRRSKKRLLRQVRSGSTQTHDDTPARQALQMHSLTHHHGRSQRIHAESVGEAAAIRQDANLDMSQSFQGQPGTAVFCRDGFRRWPCHFGVVAKGLSIPSAGVQLPGAASRWLRISRRERLERPARCVAWRGFNAVNGNAV